MDISEGELAQVKKEEDAMFHEVIDIKTEIVKEEPRETVFFIKCEMCKDNSSNEAECVHKKNDRLGDLDSKLQVPTLFSADGLYNNTFKEDVKPKVENIESNSSLKEEVSITELINTEVMLKEEEYLDSPEYLPIDVDLVECEIGQVKTDDNSDIFFENVMIDSVKEEPIDNEASLNSDMLVQDEDSNEDVQPGSSKESQKAIANKKGKKYCLVPGCKSSTICTPKKIFIPLPRDKNERLSWQRAMGKSDFVSQKSSYYCCEDHFKLEEDAENYMQVKMMGNVKLKMKAGIVPSLFACQKDSGPPREYPSKRCLPDVVEEACSSEKKSRKSKEVRDQATQTEYHLFMRDVGVQVNLYDDEELKQMQSKTKKAPKKRTKKIK